MPNEVEYQQQMNPPPTMVGQQQYPGAEEAYTPGTMCPGGMGMPQPRAAMHYGAAAAHAAGTVCPGGMEILQQHVAMHPWAPLRPPCLEDTITMS